MDLEPLRAAAADLLLGAVCHGCGAPWWGVCPECRARLGARTPYRTAPRPPPAGFPPTVTSSPYDPILRGLISAHKERRAQMLTPVLGDRLAQSVRGLLELTGAPPGPLVLVPVPSTPAAVRRRGFDSTVALARCAARILRARRPVLVRRLLRTGRGVADQAGLDASARRQNLQGAYRTRPEGVRGGIVLVDDVVTTGATLAEAARAVAATGRPPWGAATVAATVLRRDGPGPAPSAENWVRI